MSYIKRDVNIILLFLMIGIIAALIGITTYYQTTYLNLSKGYTSKINEYNQLLTNLEKNRLKLNETMAQFELKSEREADLTEKYTILRDKNLFLEFTLNETNMTLLDTKETLSDTQNELAQSNRDLSSARAENFNLNQTVKSLNTKVAIYKSRTFEVSADMYSAIGTVNDAIASNSTTPTYYHSKLDDILDKLNEMKEHVEYMKRLS